MAMTEEPQDQPVQPAAPPDPSPALLDRLAALEAGLTQAKADQVALVERVQQLESLIPLITDVDRYQRLQTLLQQGNLREADQETLRVIMQAAAQNEREGLTPDQVKQFPCSVLQVIDRLWTQYTDQRFGFSVQLAVYQEVGGSLSTAISQDLAVLIKLGDRLGWRANGKWKTSDQASYSPQAPVGCYPVVWWDSPYGAKMVNYFLSRLFTCEL